MYASRQVIRHQRYFFSSGSATLGQECTRALQKIVHVEELALNFGTSGGWPHAACRSVLAGLGPAFLCCTPLRAALALKIRCLEVDPMRYKLCPVRTPPWVLMFFFQWFIFIYIIHFYPPVTKDISQLAMFDYPRASLPVGTWNDPPMSLHGFNEGNSETRSCRAFFCEMFEVLEIAIFTLLEIDHWQRFIIYYPQCGRVPFQDAASSRSQNFQS